MTLNRLEVIKELESVGLSITPPRVVITTFLFNSKHPTAEDVTAHAKKNLPKVNVATIYNVMKDLEAAKLIKKIKFPHLEQMVYDVNTHDYYHFLDMDTGEIVDIEPDQVTLSNKLQDNFQVQGFDILFKGKIKK